MKRLQKVSIVLVVLGMLIGAVLLPSIASAGDSYTPAPAYDRLIVHLKPGATWNQTTRTGQDSDFESPEAIAHIGAYIVTVPKGTAPQKLEAFRLDPRVSSVEVDSVAEALDTPDDPNFFKQWGLVKIQATEAWNISKSAPEVKIAILDTGIDLDHPDLAGKIIASANFSSSDTVEDRHGHGTHVAGISAAITDNGMGVAGLGYSASLMNVKVLGDSGSGFYSSVIKGIIWAADNGANVINLSLGAASVSTTLEEAIDYAWSKGVVVVAAAGNAGNTTPMYPAAYTNCLAVAATDSSDSLASWSSRGDWVDVAAPGSSIYSTIPDGYGYKSGTSMASPHVAGLASLVFSTISDASGNGLLNDEVRAKIEATCDQIGVSGIGYGRINAYRAGIIDAPLGQELTLICDATPNTTTVGRAVDFTSTPAGGVGPYTYAWVFGDGNTSTLKNPSHTYAAAGSYNACVTVTDVVGNTKQCCKTVTAYSAGDANGDGIVNMGDVNLVERIILGLAAPTSGADANSDSVISMAYINKIERIILGLDR